MSADMHIETNTISFKIEQSIELKCDIISIFVDNVNLIQLLKQYEVQFDRKIAGGYEGLAANSIYNLEKHFLGQLDENDLYNVEGKVILLDCNCGTPECWPMLVHITALEDHIVWSDFEQPHRREDSPGGYWDYSNFKALQFDRGQYMRELQSLKAQLNP
jgi:hypothetical protein